MLSPKCHFSKLKLSIFLLSINPQSLNIIIIYNHIFTSKLKLTTNSNWKTILFHFYFKRKINLN